MSTVQQVPTTSFVKPTDVKDTILDLSVSRNILVPRSPRVLQLTQGYFNGVTEKKVVGQKYHKTKYIVAFLTDLKLKTVPLGKYLTSPECLLGLQHMIQEHTNMYEKKAVTVKLNHPELETTDWLKLEERDVWLKPYLDRVAELPASPLTIIIRIESFHGTDMSRNF